LKIIFSLITLFATFLLGVLVAVDVVAPKVVELVFVVEVLAMVLCR
jgi:hypothetical protein